jgi:hypothetical protein
MCPFFLAENMMVVGGIKGEDGRVLFRILREGTFICRLQKAAKTSPSAPTAPLGADPNKVNSGCFRHYILITSCASIIIRIGEPTQ